jgi:N-acetylneuraminic acid mutarotase
MASGRDAHTATLLPNGKVLVAGGDQQPQNYGQPVIYTAELYDPNTETWTNTGQLNAQHIFHTATLLPNGKVLVAGGNYVIAELYDSASQTWTVTGSMNQSHEYGTATLLPDGTVLVAGGQTATAEIYNPATETWTNTGKMSFYRSGHTATMLPNGKVLVAGGNDYGPDVSSAELYDPATQSWTNTNPMSVARSFHTATLLPNGQVLVAGGSSNTALLSSAEIYDPISETWTNTTPMFDARDSFTATMLTNSKVLIIGGEGPVPVSSAISKAELYDYTSGQWTHAGSLVVPRFYHTATLLPSGLVLVAGGYQYSATAELSDFRFQVGLIKAVKPTFSNLAEGDNYQMQTSSDMATWINSGTPFTATNSVMVYPQYFDVTNWNSLFFRLQTAP